MEERKLSLSLQNSYFVLDILFRNTFKYSFAYRKEINFYIDPFYGAMENIVYHHSFRDLDCSSLQEVPKP
jgi:hypothetical protein